MPVLGALAVLMPSLAWRAGRLKFPALFWIGAVVSIAFVYFIRYASHGSGRWLGQGLHYSTHAAVAISFGVTLSVFRLRLLPLMAVIVGGYLWMITYLPYHTPGDVISTAAVILPLSILCHLGSLAKELGKSEK